MSPLITHDGDELMLGLLAGAGDEAEDEPEGRLLGLEPLRISDVALARDETWLSGMCTGELTTTLEEHPWRIAPGPSSARDRVKGFLIEMKGPRRTFRKHFGTRTLSSAARRAALMLRERELLAPDEDYSFFLTTRPADERPRAASDPCGELQARRVCEPLHLASEPLAEWLSRSKACLGPVGTKEPSSDAAVPSEIFPVFIPHQVWDEARELSRLGGENESAAALVGELCRDTDSPAIFLRITECLRAEHAVEEKFSVGFSGDTWDQMRCRVEQRRRKLNRPGEMIVGTAHGHNFKPSPDAAGRMTCEACAVLEVCSRSTAHASEDDLRFHQSVFTEAPWAVLLLWGWNAREEEEWRLYGLKDATLSPRSVRIVE